MYLTNTISNSVAVPLIITTAANNYYALTASYTLGNTATGQSYKLQKDANLPSGSVAILNFATYSIAITAAFTFTLEFNGLIFQTTTNHATGAAFITLVTTTLATNLNFVNMIINSTYTVQAAATTLFVPCSSTVTSCSNPLVFGTAQPASKVDHSLFAQTPNTAVTITITGGTYSVVPGFDGFISVTKAGTSVTVQDAVFNYGSASTTSSNANVLFNAITIVSTAAAVFVFQKSSLSTAAAPLFQYNTGIQLVKLSGFANYVKMINIQVQNNVHNTLPLIYVDTGSRLLIQDSSNFKWNTNSGSVNSGVCIYAKDSFVQVKPATASNVVVFDSNTGY